MLNKIKKSETILVLVHSHGLKKIVSKIMGYLIKNKFSGIYISINVPHKTIDKLLKKEGLKTDKVIYIDCITATSHVIPTQKEDNVIFADHPSDLRHDGRIMNEISQFLISVPGKKYVVIDTLRTMLIYNEPAIVSEFTDRLIEVTKDSNSKLIVLTRKEDDEELIREISYRFDEIIDI